MSMTIVREFDVNTEEPVILQNLPDLLVSGDVLAHRFIARVTRGNEPLTGANTATGYFRRSDGTTVIVPGIVNADGSVECTLSQNCYNVPGWAQLALRVVENSTGAIITVLALNMQVAQLVSGQLIDPEQTIPSLDNLLNLIERMEAAVEPAEQIISVVTAHGTQIESLTAGLNQAVSTIDGILLVDERQDSEIKNQTALNIRQEHRIANLEAAAQGFLYRTETDYGIYYERYVPDDAMPWATLDMIGGHSEIVGGTMVDFAPSRIVSTGRNMLNVTNETIVQIQAVDISGTTGTRWGVPVRVAVDGTYYISTSQNIGLYKVQTDGIRQYIEAKKNFSLVLEAGEYFICCITSRSQSTAKTQLTSINLMMVPGTTAPAYEPYIETSIDLTDAVQVGFGGVMRSAGDVFDAIAIDEYGSGFAIRRVGDDHTALEEPIVTSISADVPSAVNVHQGGRIIIESEQGIAQFPCSISYFIKLVGGDV